MQQGADTVYEFNSPPIDEEEDNQGGQANRSTSKDNANKQQRNKQSSSLNTSSTSHNTSITGGGSGIGAVGQQPPTRIAGTNLRPNKASSTSIDQKLNTSFSSISDSYTASSNMAPGNSKKNNNPQLSQLQQRLTSAEISASEEQLLIKAETASSGGGDGGGSSSSNTNLLASGVGGGTGPGSMSNMSNTSLSSATNSSRGNISQSGGNQSCVSVSSQKSLSGLQQSSVSSQQQNPNFDSNVISERVKNLATQIYQELKRIISRCNYDEDILSGLMPLIVRVLESLDLALIENQQLQVELELCKDDNEQLVIMFDKEKAAKRAIDKKLIESEYAYEEERQQYQQKIDSLDNVVKKYELKAKNASDQATRFEEKEAERKKEYNKLHDRYTELLKSHCDIVERFRQLAGSSEIANLNVPHQMVASSSDLTVGDLHSHPLNRLKLSHDDEFHDKNTSSIRPRETLKTWNADTELTLEDASLVVIDDMVEASSQHNKTGGDGSSHNESDRATSEPGEGEHEKESENDSIAYTSMEKEFRKLIQENKDLLNTKNALNVVKDDLIAEVDRLTNEVSMYEQAVEQLNSTKDQMKQKVSTLDAELRKTKEELEKAKQKIRESNEEGVPYSQRKRFGRAEMAKVLMERNNYKERFMELQDAVRYTELVRANRIETEKRSGLWKFFSNLFGAPPMPPTRAILGSPRDASPVVSFNNSTGGTSVGLADRSAGQMVAADALQTSAAGRASTGSIWLNANQQRLSGNSGGGGSISGGSDCIVLMDSDPSNVDRTNRAGSRDSGGGASGDSSGYIHAYGWSLRASSLKGLNADPSSSQGESGGGIVSRISPILGGTSSHTSADASQGGDGMTFSAKLAGLQVPIPQYCRPLTGDSLGMKIWCATAIDLSGGDLSKCTRRIVELPRESEEERQGNNSLDTIDTTNTTSATHDEDTSGSLVNISTSTPVKSPKGQNERALKELELDVNRALNEPEEGTSDLLSSSQLPLLKTTTDKVLSALPFADDVEELSTCVWICSTQHSRSKITIIDMKNKPNELLDSFYVPTFLYCIKSIPGCKPSDLLGLAAGSSSRAQSSAGESEGASENDQNGQEQIASSATTQGITLNMINELVTSQRDEFYKLVRVDTKAERRLQRDRPEVDKMLREQVAATATSGASSTALDTDKLINESIIELTAGAQSAKAHARVATTSEDDAEISRLLDDKVTDGIATLQKLNDFVAHTQPQEQSVDATSSKDGRGEEKQGTGMTKDASYYQPISTHLSTVWMGGKDCVLYIHSAIGQWKDCVACVELPDSILQICHYRGRAFVALADGSLCVFFRNIDTKQWDFSQYLLVNIGLMNDVTTDSLTGSTHESMTGANETSLGDLHSRLTNLILDEENPRPSSADDGSQQRSPSSTNQARDQSPQTGSKPTSPSHSSGKRPTTPQQSKRRGKVSGVHCLEISNKNLWLGHRNRVFIFDPITMRLKHTFNVVPQVDNQIRQMVSMKDGVFICLRSDLTLRLYSSLRPYQHIQNIDIEPVVTRLISPKTFVISHITSMRVADNTLWIGIAHGIILTIPCKLMPQISEAPMRNSLTGEFEESPSHLSIARFVPKCDINSAQVSFHGHRDAVKFFIHAHELMLSGGQGYLDFRLDMDDQSKAISDKSHLILWQLPS